MSINYNLIGVRLKQARLDKKITQEKLAEKIEVSITYISRIERGSTNINLRRLSEICNVLKISEGEILNGCCKNSSYYLSKEFNSILKNCPPEKIELIYNIAELVAKNPSKTLEVSENPETKEGEESSETKEGEESSENQKDEESSESKKDEETSETKKYEESSKAKKNKKSSETKKSNKPKKTKKSSRAQHNSKKNKH